jgi:hypothetical protein
VGNGAGGFGVNSGSNLGTQLDADTLATLQQMGYTQADIQQILTDSASQGQNLGQLNGIPISNLGGGLGGLGGGFGGGLGGGGSPLDGLFGLLTGKGGGLGGGLGGLGGLNGGLGGGLGGGGLLGGLAALADPIGFSLLNSGIGGSSGGWTDMGSFQPFSAGQDASSSKTPGWTAAGGAAGGAYDPAKIFAQQLQGARTGRRLQQFDIFQGLQLLAQGNRGQANFLTGLTTGTTLPTASNTFDPNLNQLLGGQPVNNLGQNQLLDPSALYTGGVLGGGQFAPAPAVSRGAPVFDPTTGTWVGALPATPGTTGTGVPSSGNPAAGNGSFTFTGGYWGYCPSPPAPGSVITAPPPPPRQVTTALIKAPRTGATVTVGPGGKGVVRLDGTESTPAPGRNLVGYGWTVRQLPDQQLVATGTGPTATVQLSPGQYFTTLLVLDTAGESANSSAVFNVGTPGGGSPVMAAVIASPPEFVTSAASGNTSISLDATGSTASPGRQIISYAWTITTGGSGTAVTIATRTGRTGSVSVPVGLYKVRLVVKDSGGLTSDMEKTFAVGRNVNGLVAVINRPLSYVAPNPNGGVTSVTLDATGSTPPRGATLTQFIWALLRDNGAGNRPSVANVTGRTATVQLAEGRYTVGLLVVASDANNTVVQKNFTVGSAAGGNVNVGPVIPAGQTLRGNPGGSVVIQGVVDPNGDPVSLTWTLSRGNQQVKDGTGTVVSLSGVSAGTYTLAITATDGRGGRSTGDATVIVSGSSNAAPAPKPGPGPTPTPVPTPPAGLQLRLPSLTVAPGTLVEIDVASAGVPVVDLGKYNYNWQVVDAASKITRATSTSRVFKYRLRDLGQSELTLTVTPKPGGNAPSPTQKVTSVLRALPVEGGVRLPTIAQESTCGPFTGQVGKDVTLSCPQVTATGPNATNLQWAWRVVNTTAKPEPLVYTRGPEPNPNFGRLQPGVYVAEVAIGAGAKPSRFNSVYFLSTILQVRPAGAANAANAKPAANSKPAAAPAKPASPKPANAKPASPKPASPKPASPKPASPKPANAKPASPKPANAKPASPKPASPKPASPKPASPKPANAKPASPSPKPK